MSHRMTSNEVRRYKKRTAALYGSTCYFCHDDLDLDDLTLEHLIPTARGGSVKGAENHALACFDCNNFKSGLTVEEYCLLYSLNLSDFPRRGALRVGLTDIGEVTNRVDLARLGLIG
jgi:hypothetical protein